MTEEQMRWQTRRHRLEVSLRNAIAALIYATEKDGDLKTYQNAIECADMILETIRELDKEQKI
jgi:hypothetical protein